VLLQAFLILGINNISRRTTDIMQTSTPTLWQKLGNSLWLNPIAQNMQGQEGTVVRDPKVSQPLWQLNHRLITANHLQPLTGLKMLNSKEYNAYMDATGMMTYTTEFLKQATSPAEVAFVTAHELAHDKANHALQIGLLNLTLAPIGILASSFGIGTIFGVGYVASKKTLKATQPSLKVFMQTAWSVLKKCKFELALLPVGLLANVLVGKAHRYREREADAEALALLKQAGLPTNGYRPFLVHAALAEARLARNPLSWWDMVLLREHEAPPERLQRLKTLEKVATSCPSPLHPLGETPTAKVTLADKSVSTL
jgi:Zn-dependent protease with chaperone function